MGPRSHLNHLGARKLRLAGNDFAEREFCTLEKGDEGRIFDQSIYKGTADQMSYM